MSLPSRGGNWPRQGRRFGLTSGIEALERRSLLATDFSAPDLTPYINAADHGIVSASAAIDSMTSALETQLTSGPLTDLMAGTIDISTFNTNVADLVTSYASSIAASVPARFPNVATIMKLQGTKIASEIDALATRQSSGLITSEAFQTQAATAIDGVDGGTLTPLHAPLSGYSAATTALLDDLRLLTPALATDASPSLTVSQIQSVAKTDRQGYRDTIAASLHRRPGVMAEADKALDVFDAAIDALATDGSAASSLSTAIDALNAALLDTTGLFGPRGMLARMAKRS